MEIQVSSAGLHTKAHPSGLGLIGSGGLYSPPYVDRYRKLRTLTAPELIAQIRNVVYICATRNAEAVSRVPQKLYVQTSKGEPRPKCRIKGLTTKQETYLRSNSSISGRIAGDSDVEEVLDHPYLDLVANPNPYMGLSYLSKINCMYEDTVGNSYWYMGELNRLGVPKEIWPLPAHQVWPMRTDPDSEELINYWAFATGRNMLQIDPKFIVHFHDFSPWEPYALGMAPLQALIEHVTVSEQLLGHMQAVLDNQARPDALLSPDEVIGEFEAKRLNTQVNQRFRAGGMGGIMVAESSMKLTPMGWGPMDLGVIEFLVANRDLICNAYGVPITMLTSSAARAERDSARAQHAEDAVLPRITRRDDTINRRIIPAYDESGRLFVASDNPVQEDDDFELKKTQQSVAGGWMLRGEARKKDGLEQADWADKPTLPGNLSVLGDDGMPTVDPNNLVGNMDGDGNIFGKPSPKKKPPAASGQPAASSSGQPKKPKKNGSEKKPTKSGKYLADLSNFAASVKSGSLTRQGAIAALAATYALPPDQVAAAFPGEVEPADKSLDLALAELHKPEADASTELKVLDLWHQKGLGGQIKWTEPEIDGIKDQGDIRKKLPELEKCGYKIGIDELSKVLQDGKLKKLKDDAWSALVNSESQHVNKLSDVIERAHRNKKKIRGVVREYVANEVRAPLLLCLPGSTDQYFLLDGETRLSIAHLFDVRPRCWFADLPEDYAVQKALGCLGQTLSGKDVDAARQRLAELPAVANGEVPVPFVVRSDAVRHGDIGAATPQTVKLFELFSPKSTLSKSSLEAALEDPGAAEQPVVCLAADGSRCIIAGVEYLAACVLLGLDEVEVKVIHEPAPAPLEPG